MGNRLYIKREFSLNFNNLTMTGMVLGDESKVPILCLHGWLDNAACFEIIAPKIKDRHLIALDFIGHGQSSHRALNHPYYIWDNVTDLYSALEALKIDKIDILGHSMGASVAVLFAACFPEKVSRLYLIEGLAPLNYAADKLPLLMAKAIRKRVAAKSSPSRSHIDLNTFINARSNSFFPVSLTAAEMLVKRGTQADLNGYRWSSDPALLLPSINRMGIGQIEAFLQAIKVPVVLYLAEQGLVDDQWREYFKYVEQLKVHTFCGNHHLHMQEEGANLIAQSLSECFAKCGPIK